MGDASAVPVFVQLLDDSDREIAQAAQGCLATFPGPEADAAVTEMFASGDADKQRMALDLMGRRRMARRRARPAEGRPQCGLRRFGRTRSR